MSTATATAYDRRAVRHPSCGVPKRRKAQEQRVFRGNGARWACIKDNVLLDSACGTGGFLTSALKLLARQVKTTAGWDAAKVEIKRRLVEEFNLHTVVRMPQSVFAPYTSITTNILFFDNTDRGEGVWFYRMDMPDGYKRFSKTKPIRPEHFDRVREWWSDRKVIELPDGPKAKRYSVDELVAGGFNFDLCG